MYVFLCVGFHRPMIYTQHNSGSYCNQNMILDYNLFKPGQPLVNGTVIVSEQIPGQSSTPLTWSKV